MIEEEAEDVTFRCRKCGSELRAKRTSIPACGGPPENQHSYSLMMKVEEER